MRIHAAAKTKIFRVMELLRGEMMQFEMLRKTIRDTEAQSGNVNELLEKIIDELQIATTL